MKNLLARLLSLDDERSIWVEEEDLGKDKAFHHEDKRYFVKIPERIDKKITLRLRGFGKKRRNKKGDLFLHIWLNKGEDVSKTLWLSETMARNGGDKRLILDGKAITMVIPPKSYNGLTIRLRGYGREAFFDPCAPALHPKKRGNALVKLMIYPEHIRTNYRPFESLSTDNMAWEGWVYRKIDEVISKVGKSFFSITPLTADAVADLLNEWGWESIFKALVNHLGLEDRSIELAQSATISRPGSCEGNPITQNNTLVGYIYKITINEQYLDNPFSIAAILAHELCHVVYSDKIENTPRGTGHILKSEKATLEEEHTVDLLVFMFGMGEFQLRVARDKRLTLGYFNQEVFDRIQAIVSRKLKLS